MSAASSLTLNALDFQLRPVNSAQDMMRNVPGLVTAQHAGGGKAEQIFLRGFDADHGTDVASYVDGIPVNMSSHGHGQGYMDLHFLLPELVKNVEVFKGTYFVLLTFAFGEIVNLIMQDWVSLTNGNSGLFGIPKFAIFGFRLTAIHHYYAMGLIFTAISVGVLWAIERSDIGAIFQSLNENEMVTRSLGGNAIAWRIAAFVLSAFIAGISGGIYAFYIGLLSPDAFGLRTLVDLIVMNTIGGPARIVGPLMGAILIVPLPDLLRDAREYQLLIYGLCLVVFLMFFRQGLVALLRVDGLGSKR